MKIIRTPSKLAGGVTAEEKIRLKAHADKWIATAMRTGRGDRRKIVEAVHRMYEVAGLERPNVVIVSSPLAMAFAGGAAAWILHCRKNDLLRSVTSGATYDATYVSTMDATRNATNSATKSAVDVATFNAVNAATSAATNSATSNATHTATSGATHAVVDPATRDAVENATHDATRKAVDVAVRNATHAAVNVAAYAATLAATSNAANSATNLAIDDATRDETSAATRVVVDDAVDGATYAVNAAVDNAVRVATGNATRNATGDATYSAADDGTRNAVDTATRNAVDTATRNTVDAATSAAANVATSAAAYDATYVAANVATSAAAYVAANVATSAAAYDATYAAASAATRDAVDDATRNAVDAATRNAVSDEIYVATHDATSDAVEDATSAATIDATRHAVEDVVGDMAKACFDFAGRGGMMCAENWYRNYQGGNMWASYESYLTACRSVLGLRLPEHEAYAHWEVLAQESGFRWVHKDFCIVSDLPDIIKKDEQNRPHCEDGPSHKWSDGWSLYHWHGVVVPEFWIMDKKKLTPAIALAEANVEKRRAACEIIGWAKVLKELDAKTIDRDGDPEIGELVEVNLPDAGRSRFLTVTCGTGRKFSLPVPLDCGDTAIAASAWTYGIDDFNNYKPEVRT